MPEAGGAGGRSADLHHLRGRVIGLAMNELCIFYRLEPGWILDSVSNFA